MAARRLLNPNMNKIWFGHTETWPVIACIGVAVAWCGWCSGSYLTSSPDVQWSKDMRGSTVRENFDEGERWVSHKKKWIETEVENIAMYRGIKKKYPSA